jgi:hypothetical protein
MQTYANLLALSKDERETELKTTAARGVVLLSEKTILQKVAAKTLCAMKSAGEITGNMNTHAVKITGHDIRLTLQNVYELVSIFTAIQAGEIELTEEDFDTLDASKLALLNPFLTKPELKDKLGEAVKAAKNGTAKDIRALKPKKDKDGEKAEKPESETTRIPVGFAATDIGPTDPLVNSAQFKARIKADMIGACDTANGEAIETMLETFGRMFLIACSALGEDPLDFVAAHTAANAKPAEGKVVDAPALETAAA